MPEFDRMPSGFRILSETPILRVRFRSQANGCLIVFLLPFVTLFLVYACYLIWALYDILNFGAWQVFQNLSSTISKYWWFPFAFLSLSVPTWYVLWHTFGITHFQASQESLIVVKQLFIKRLEKSISNTEI